MRRKLIPSKVSRLSKKLIACLMRHGARTRAERIFDTAIETVRRKIRGAVTPEQILVVAIENARPYVMIQRHRVGGVVYEVPTVVPRNRSTTLALRTIAETARTLRGRTMAGRLARAILAAYRNEFEDCSE